MPVSAEVIKPYFSPLHAKMIDKGLVSSETPFRDDYIVGGVLEVSAGNEIGKRLAETSRGFAIDLVVSTYPQVADSFAEAFNQGGTKKVEIAEASLLTEFTGKSVMVIGSEEAVLDLSSLIVNHRGGKVGAVGVLYHADPDEVFGLA